MHKIATAILAIVICSSAHSQVINTTTVVTDKKALGGSGNNADTLYQCHLVPNNPDINVAFNDPDDYTPVDHAICDDQPHYFGEHDWQQPSGTVTMTATSNITAERSTDIVWSYWHRPFNGGDAIAGTYNNKTPIRPHSCSAEVHNLNISHVVPGVNQTATIVTKVSPGSVVTISPATHDDAGGYLSSSANHLPYRIDGTYEGGKYTLPSGSTEARVTVIPSKHQAGGRYTGEAVATVSCE